MANLYSLDGRARRAPVDQLQPQLATRTDVAPGPGERARISRACRGVLTTDNHLQGEPGEAALQRAVANRRQLPPGDRPSFLRLVVEQLLEYAGGCYWAGLIGAVALALAVRL